VRRRYSRRSEEAAAVDAAGGNRDGWGCNDVGPVPAASRSAHHRPCVLLVGCGSGRLREERERSSISIRTTTGLTCLPRCHL